jgi:cytochrome b involved in lipid metabolism
MTDASFENSSIVVKFPSYRNESSKSIKKWLEAKQQDDNAENLWRIHDKLYDLINFVRRHPGGADWLELTQGTDITELFESHHISRRAEMLLPNFYVSEAKKSRNYRTTFIDDGFYTTLKKKVADQVSVMNKTATKNSDVNMIVFNVDDTRLSENNFRKLLTRFSSQQSSA